MQLNNLLVIPETGVLVAPDYGQYLLNIRSQEVYNRLREGVLDLDQRQTQIGDSIVVALPIHADTLTILGNLGFDIRGMEPFFFNYAPPLVEGVHMPKPHQVQTAAFLSARTRAFCGSTPRTGKTYSASIAAHYLRRCEGIKGSTLIIATVTNLEDVWEDSIEATLDDARVVTLYGGTGKESRLKMFKEPYADFYITNYDGVKMLEKELTQAADAGIITVCMIDELTHYSNCESERYIAMEKVINIPNSVLRLTKPRVPYVWGFSGSLTDDASAVFDYLKLINPWRLPCDRKPTWEYMVKEKYGPERWHIRERAEAKNVIKRFLQPTIRFEQEDVMPEIPDTDLVIVQSQLSDQQKLMYDKLRSDLIVHLEQGGTVDGSQKSALVHKLYQIALGTVTGKDGQVIELDYTPRLNTILEEIKNAQFKTVIFGCYTESINRLVRDLRTYNLQVEKIDGKVVGSRRKKLLKQFLNRKDLDVLICHPTTTAFGAEMASASTFIFNGPPIVGSFKYGQAKRRGSSLKQQADQVRLVQLCCTIEERKSFEGLDKQQRQSSITNGILADLTGRPQGARTNRPPRN